MKNLKIIFSTLVFTTLVSCVNSDDYNAPDLSGDCSTLTTTKTVQEVKATATTTAQQYVNDDIIEAYVTSSDEGGNFYKSISMVSVDGVQGFSMPVDDYNLYTKYEPGRKVYIKLKINTLQILQIPLLLILKFIQFNSNWKIIRC